MKEKLTRNGALKLISLFCAFFVWLAVVNVANPTKMSTEEVKVEFINGQVLEKSNLTYEIVGKSTATISFKVRTKDEYKITPSDFHAYADLSEMYDVTGAIPIKVEVVNNEALLLSAPVVKSPEVVKVQTEELQTKSFTLTAKTQGSPQEGYQEGEVTMFPAQVSVRGPLSKVGQISTVGIEFNVDGAVSELNGTAEPKYYDANGNELLLGDSVTTVGGAVSYTMQILKVKQLPLDFVVSGEVAEGYRFTGAEAAVSAVSVAGLKSDLASVNTISIQDPSLNIQGATEDKHCRIELNAYLDPKLTIAGMDETVIDVILKVEPLREKQFYVEPEAVMLEGEQENLIYSLEEERAEITIRGLKEDLDSLSAEKMNLHADVSDLEKGTHKVQARLELDDAFEVISYPELTVIVEEQSQEDTEKIRNAVGKQEYRNETEQESD